jgi:hypothetical protein
MATLLGMRFGTVHCDLKDDEAGWTVLIPLGIMPEGSHLGTFVDARLGSFVEWDAADPGLFIFKGSDPHVGTPATPPPSYSPSPSTFHSRAVVVAYPSRSANHPLAASAVDSPSFLTNKTLHSALQSSLPFLSQRAGFAAAGGELAAKHLLVRARARASIETFLRGELEWAGMGRLKDVEGRGSVAEQRQLTVALEEQIETALAFSSEFGRSWASLVRFEARRLGCHETDEEIASLVRAGNPFGWVEGEEQDAYCEDQTKEGRKRAEEVARGYFLLARTSAVKMRNLVKNGRTKAGAAHLVSRGYEPTLISTQPVKLLALLVEQGWEKRWIDVIELREEWGCPEIKLKYQWARQPGASPFPPIPPLFPPPLIPPLLSLSPSPLPPDYPAYLKRHQELTKEFRAFPALSLPSPPTNSVRPSLPFPFFCSPLHPTDLSSSSSKPPPVPLPLPPLPASFSASPSSSTHYNL